MSEDRQYRKLGDLLKKYLSDSKLRCQESRSDFNIGYDCAVKCFISSLLQQADGFIIDLKELNLDGIDQNRDLV